MAAALVDSARSEARKLINIIFTGEYEFDVEPVMDEELATEGIASLNIRQQTMVMAYQADYKAWSKLKSSAIRETYPQLFLDLVQTIEEANMRQIRSFYLEVEEPRRMERKKGLL
jgi:hypothetical protein